MSHKMHYVESPAVLEFCLPDLWKTLWKTRPTWLPER